MYKLEAKGYESSQLIESVEDILGQTKLLSMATVKGTQPWINTAGFAADDALRLYIVTYPQAVHSQNIESNDRVAVAVFDSQQPGKLKQGLQLLGTCRQLDGDQADRGLRLWATRIIGEAALDKFMTSFPSRGAKVYEITVGWVKILDEQRNGVNTWIECDIARPVV